MKFRRQLTALVSICCLSLFSVNLQTGQLGWQNAAYAAGSGTGAGGTTDAEGAYKVNDVPSGDGSELESATNMTMLLMLAAAAVALYAELSCHGLMSIHIYAGTAAAFVAGYLFQIQSLQDDIDDIIARYKDFNFSTSTALEGANRDMQIEAYKLCQEENKTVAENLRSIAMLHYMVAVGFAAAAAWAMFMESPKPLPGCPNGMGCGGSCAKGAFLGDGSRYHGYAYLDVEMFFNGQLALPSYFGEGCPSFSLNAPNAQKKQVGSLTRFLSKFFSQSAPIWNPIWNLEPFLQDVAAELPPLPVDADPVNAENMPGATEVKDFFVQPDGATTSLDGFTYFQDGSIMDPSGNIIQEASLSPGEAARASQAGNGPLAEMPEKAPDAAPNDGTAAPHQGEVKQAQKDDSQLLDKYWVRALIFAGFAIFAYFVGSMYDENAEIYDARAAACAELEQKLQESSDSLEGIQLEEGTPSYTTSQYAPTFSLPRHQSRSYQLVAEFFQEIAWQLQQARLGILAQMVPNALANTMPTLENRTCFIAGNRNLPQLISCQQCADGAHCLQPKIMSSYQERNNLPTAVNQNLQDLGEYEYLLYAGQQPEAMKVVKKLARQKQQTKDELERMIKHFLPQMVANGAPNLPYEQLMERYQQEVKKMGTDYLQKLSGRERREFLAQFSLPKTSTHFNTQLAQMIKEQEPFAKSSIAMGLSVEERKWVGPVPPANESHEEETTGTLRVSEGMAPSSVDQQAFGELLQRADISLRPEQSLFQIISRRYQRTFGEN